MNNINYNLEDEIHKNININSPTEKNSKFKFNPNNDKSPNIFKSNLQFRINNYYLISELDKNKLSL